MHAFMHRLEWMKWGRQEDFIAWKGLAKLISSAEASRLALVLSNQRRKSTKQSAELIEKRANALRGRAKNDDHRQAIAAALTGRRLTADHKAHISEGLKGKKRSSEFSEKQSARMKGRQYALGSRRSTEQKLRYSEAAKKRWAKQREVA